MEPANLSRVAPDRAKQVGNIILQVGRVSFWSQLVLGIVATVVFGLASLNYLVIGSNRTPGGEVAVVCAFVSLGILVGSICISYRYFALSRKLKSPDLTERPKKSGTIKLVQLLLVINLIGLLLGLVGAQSMVGIALFKTLSQGPNTFNTDPTKIVNSLDLLTVLSNLQAITAHTAGLITSLWLLNRINK